MLKKIVFTLIFILAVNSGYCLDINRLKSYFLSGDYKSAIMEGEKILKNYNANSPGLDELYYFMGLSYLKDGNYLRASDIFEIILREFKDSSFKDEAQLGLGDTYFLKGDYDKAKGHYSQLLNTNPATKLKAQAYYRLSETAFKAGDTQAAKNYLDKLKNEFPLSPEKNIDKDLYAVSDICYSVQVGAFANPNNANRLRDKLTSQGYDAYVQEVDANLTKSYRVRVGRLKSRSETEQLEGKLSQDGYPTKIVP
jgi:tetratricopeptide (TPR) repeat protein